MALDLTPYPTIPGGFEAGAMTTSNFSYTFVSKQEAFQVEARGLIPSTLHFVFFENRRVANSDIKPLNGALGDLLYTDINGTVSFTFYYRSEVQGVTSEQLYAEQISRIGGDKELVIVSSNTDVVELPTLYENIYTSYAKKNIFFKTSKVAELPVKSNYSFAYPPTVASASDDGGAGAADGGSDDY